MESQNARKLIESLEERYESKIPRRLRFVIIDLWQKDLNDKKRIKDSINALFEGHETYNPKTQKAIQRSNK